MSERRTCPKYRPIERATFSRQLDFHRRENGDWLTLTVWLTRPRGPRRASAPRRGPAGGARVGGAAAPAGHAARAPHGVAGGVELVPVGDLPVERRRTLFVPGTLRRHRPVIP